jgi:tetratricopeptide (TPR) repeat protein
MVAISNPVEYLPQMQAEAEKALRLDPDLNEAHTLQARVKGFACDWKAMEQELLKSLELQPNSRETHFQYAQLLMCLGKHDQALTFLKHSMELDPLADPDDPELAVAFNLAGRIDESIAIVDRALKKDSTNVELRAFQAANYAEKGMIQETHKEIELVMASEPDPWTGAYFNIAAAYELIGDHAQAQAMHQAITKAAISHYIDPVIMASFSGLLGEVDEALACYERALKEKSSWMMYVRLFVRPGCKELKADPRFQDFLARINLAG